MTVMNPAARQDYECLRCNAQVYGATHGEITGDGWAFWRVYGQAAHRPAATMARHAPAGDGFTVALCGDCAALMRTLHAIRSVRTTEGRA